MKVSKCPAEIQLQGVLSATFEKKEKKEKRKALREF